MRAFLCLLVATVVSVSFIEYSETDEILAQLSKIHLDKKQIYNIRDITIHRDAAAISFNRGTIAFLEPVMGKVTGAVFIGSGEIVAIPPDAVEKQQLFKFTHSPVLDEPFEAAFFRFTDNTYEEIVKAFKEHAEEDVTGDDISKFLPWDRILADRTGVLNYRLLADYIGAPKPLFFAELNGNRTGWFDVVYDPRSAEEVAVMKVHERDTSFNVDVWASFNKRGETRDPELAAGRNPFPLDVLAYDIDATINANTQLDARTTLHARALVDGERVISLDLSRFLRVSSVTLENGEAVPFYQHADMTDEEIRRTGVNVVVLVLAQPTKAGKYIAIKFAYTGDVIEKRGSGIFYVGERGTWYPNFGNQDRAAFKMTFHFPSNYSLVATGKKTKEWLDGGLRHSTWESDGEFPVAGFNLGDFTILTDDTGPFPISVGVNNDVETIFREISSRRADQEEAAMRAAAVPGRRGQPRIVTPPMMSPDESVFSTKGLAENVLKEVRDTVSFYAEEFGPYPYSQLTVSQFPVNYSQGWPSLLYVSTLSFFTRDQRARLGLSSDTDFLATEMVRAHEVAHQWFGNKVGWSTYHDQWISEAFANYAGAMYLEHKYKEMPRMREIMDDARRRVLERSPDGNTYDSDGPIWLGQRLSNTAAPNGYNEVIYGKGTWIVHMLRMMMRSEGKNSDENFLAMIREFLTDYNGRNASTADLKRVAEKHMTKSMDVRGDKKLDWFFDEWVLGTGIPAYTLDYKIQPSPKGFVIEGQIKQSGVSDDFVMPVPLYADDQLLGRVVVSDDPGAFRFEVKNKPSKVLVDPQLTILAQLKN